MYKILWDFEIQMDCLMSDRKLDLALIKEKKKKKISCLVDLAVLADHGVKIKQSKNIDKYLHLAREIKSFGT